MKTLIPLIAYGLLSGLIGLVLCSWLQWKSKRPSAAAIAAAICFGGPPALYGFLYLKEGLTQTSFEQDVAYVHELCAKYGGDKIYRTVDNVEGVFQMKQRNPDQDKQWADQYGMVEPWALTFGDQSTLPVHLDINGRGYWFIEQQPEFGKPVGPPYRRKFIRATNKKIGETNPYSREKDEPAYEHVAIQSPTLRARYGYTTEDLSTPELRKRWIGGGKLKIIDLQTNEVLAERTGYYKARGPVVKSAWAGGFNCTSPNDGHFSSFIYSVLKPPASIPTAQHLSILSNE